MPDVSSNAPAQVRMRAALDVHKRTIVCASQPDDPRAGELRVEEIPNSERAVRALVRRLGGPDGLPSATRPDRAATTSTVCSARRAWRATSWRRR